MVLWGLHKIFPAMDVKEVPGYLNPWDTNCRKNNPKFNGDPSSVVDHVVKFLKNTSKINMVHEDALMSLFINSLREDWRDWLKQCKPKSIPSVRILIEEFLKYWGLSTLRIL